MYDVTVLKECTYRLKSSQDCHISVNWFVRPLHFFWATKIKEYELRRLAETTGETRVRVSGLVNLSFQQFSSSAVILLSLIHTALY